MLTALFADHKGEIYDAPGYGALARIGNDTAALRPEDLIPLPDGAELMMLPGREAVGLKKGRVERIGPGLLAVGAMLPVGYTRTCLPAFGKTAGAPLLPLYGYTAVALYKDALHVAAVKSDDNKKWHPYRYNTPDLAKKVRQVQKDLAGNRIVDQLAGCSLKWHCCTAQNLFYRRWEAGIPVSPYCNANCFGCISLQPAECCPSPQERINFSPAPEEIAAVGEYHLKGAPEPIVSFGQGCEGEPSLAAANIAKAIKLIRARTTRGLININTNAGFTAGIKEIADAGLDSMRVSIISARPEAYQAYYRGNYTLDNVRESIIYARHRGVYVSLNMLLFPGFNDRPEEMAAWKEFIASTGIEMIQLRNLNIDPDAFLGIMPPPAGAAAGVKPFINLLGQWFPRLRLGSFSPYFERQKP